MRQLQMRQLPIRRRGFTLVELMVSIAMVMLLIAGIYAVFDSATKTVGLGTAVESATASIRSLERVMHDDFAHAVSAREMPCIVIYSQQTFAYSDRKDMDADKDGKVNTADLGGTGTESPLSPVIYNARNHRFDRIAFFTRNEERPYLRQTGRQSTGELLSSGSSREAWIWYGPLRLADNNSPTSMNFRLPGDLDPNQNPNNYFANDWCLGRMVMLLDSDLVGMQPTDSNPDTDAILFTRAGSNPIDLTPLGIGSRSAGNSPWRIHESRFDVAGTSIMDFRIGACQYSPWQIRNAFNYYFYGKTQMVRSANSSNMASQLSLTMPFLQRGVTQFIIEFAGDFMDQNPDGTLKDVNNPQPDGQLDFFWRQDTSSGPRTRQIRWYGMPRNVVDPSNETSPPIILGKPSPAANPNKMIDVVPVRDVCVTASQVNANATSDRDMEVVFEGNTRTKAQYTTNYATVQNPLSYTCVFTPQMLANGHGPWMIRITMTITDPNGRLPEGQTVQYVYSLPH